MPGLAGTATTGNNVRMRNLLSFLAGSLSQVTQFYYMQSPTKLDTFEDYKTFPQRVRDTHLNEGSAFFKDDWKVLKSLTLNLGLRWEYYGVLYDARGLMPLPVGGPYRIFGISGNSFADWMKPGVRAEPTAMQFVGKNSPNPGTPWYPNDYNNFGPAVGFAWQVPWFGAGKTTVRGGYQMTYNGGPSFNSITQENVAPGSTLVVNICRRQRRQRISRSYEAAVAYPGAADHQADAADSCHGPDPADVCSAARTSSIPMHRTSRWR